MPTPTPGYQTKQEIITVGRSDYTIRSLLDRQQYSDPQGEAEAAGIPPATWPLFGLLWPSSRVLAGLMDNHNLIGKRVLEIGAGLALASLVVHRRLGDITASDWHPLSPGFLAENVLLNHLSPLKYQRGNWAGENPELGEFDLIIGSDILYERQQPQQLATFIHRPRRHRHHRRSRPRQPQRLLPRHGRPRLRLRHAPRALATRKWRLV